MAALLARCFHVTGWPKWGKWQCWTVSFSSNCYINMRWWLVGLFVRDSHPAISLHQRDLTPDWEQLSGKNHSLMNCPAWCSHHAVPLLPLFLFFFPLPSHESFHRLTSCLSIDGLSHQTFFDRSLSSVHCLLYREHSWLKYAWRDGAVCHLIRHVGNCRRFLWNPAAI